MPLYLPASGAAATNYAPSGLTGAGSASRYVGATTAGAPTSGTFVVGDYVVDESGDLWVCIVAGTPGVWTAMAGGPASGLDIIDHCAFLAGTGLGVTLARFVGSGGGGGAANPITGHPGCVTMTSGTTASGYAGWTMAMNASNAAFTWSDKWIWSAEVLMPSVVTDTDFRCGLMNGAAGGAPTTGAYFEKLAGDTNVFFVAQNASTPDTRQSISALAASTWYKLRLRWDGTKYYWSINDAAENAGYTPTNTPATGSPWPQVHEIVNSTASSRTLTLDWARLRVLGLSM